MVGRFSQVEREGEVGWGGTHVGTPFYVGRKVADRGRQSASSLTMASQGLLVLRKGRNAALCPTGPQPARSQRGL